MNKEKLLRTISVLLILSAAGYYLYHNAMAMGLSKPALVMKVSMNLTSEGDVMINNVTFEQSNVPFFYKRTDSVPQFPEIDVNARINALASDPSSFWSSTTYDMYKPAGVYTLKVFFKDGKEPKEGDILILPIRVIGTTGVIRYKTTAFYTWE